MKPTATAAPRRAPTIPRRKLLYWVVALACMYFGTPAGFAAAAATAAGTGGGGGGAALLRRNPAPAGGAATAAEATAPAGAASGADTAAAAGMASATATGAAAGKRASMLSAICVPSAPHTGQATVNGIRPPLGSTSNLYFCPHGHTTFSSIKYVPGCY